MRVPNRNPIASDESLHLAVFEELTRPVRQNDCVDGTVVVVVNLLTTRELDQTRASLVVVLVDAIRANVELDIPLGIVVHLAHVLLGVVVGGVVHVVRHGVCNI